MFVYYHCNHRFQNYNYNGQIPFILYPVKFLLDVLVFNSLETRENYINCRYTTFKPTSDGSASGAHSISQ